MHPAIGDVGTGFNTGTLVRLHKKVSSLEASHGLRRDKDPYQVVREEPA